MNANEFIFYSHPCSSQFISFVVGVFGKLRSFGKLDFEFQIVNIN